jgi:predicted RNA-binding protein
MCEANVYLRDHDRQDMLMENVDILRPEGNGLFLQNIFGERKWIEARVEEMSLVEHRIVLVGTKEA